jgi:hypothetical protein
MTGAAAASAAGTGAATGSASSGSSASCVGLVLDARSLGSSVSTDCVTVKPGATGIDVLTAAGHRLGFRSDGLICTIDGLPKTGCSGIDDTHYWSYFHRAPGSTRWVYSGEGAASYQPAACSTDGWVYDDGSALTPDNVTVHGLCTPGAKPTPTPTRAPRHHPTPPPRRHSASPSATPTATATPVATVTPTPHRRRHHGGLTSHSSQLSATLSPPAAPTTASPSASALSARDAAQTGSSGHGTWTLVTWLIVVAALLAMAVVVLRARRTHRD